MFSVTFNKSNNFSINFQNSKNLSASFHSSIYVPDVEMYVGPYEAVPMIDEQVFRTSRKMMVDDFVVTKIPYYETSNQKGITVYIADDIND